MIRMNGIAFHEQTSWSFYSFNHLKKQPPTPNKQTKPPNLLAQYSVFKCGGAWIINIMARQEPVSNCIFTPLFLNNNIFLKAVIFPTFWKRRPGHATQLQQTALFKCVPRLIDKKLHAAGRTGQQECRVSAGAEEGGGETLQVKMCVALINVMAAEPEPSGVVPPRLLASLPPTWQSPTQSGSASCQVPAVPSVLGGL